MRSNLWDDPRVTYMVDATDTNEASVIGALYWLWATADQHTSEGWMPGLTPRQIDRKTGVAGMASALQIVGWIQVADDGITLSRFTEHNGASAKSRGETARRVQEHRKRASNGKSVTDQEQVRYLEKELEKEKDLEAKATGQQAGHDAEPRDELPQDIAKPDAPAPVDEAPAAETPKRITSTGKKQTAEHFPRFWAAYPVKKGKADALKKWKSKGCDAMADQIIAHVRRMEREDDDWLRGFIPHGSTYINGERWEDEPKKDKAPTAPAPAPETFGAKAVAERNNTETPLERAMAYIRHQASLGAYGEGEQGQAGMRAAMQAAREKHGGGNGNS
ncbi:hypothetical protein QT654_20600 [Xanthomonas citri pv. citri]